jgi:hypothetical protein
VAATASSPISPPRVKPLLRGVFHELAALAAVPLST